MFAIGARTVGATELKFGTEKGLYPEMVLSNILADRTSLPGRGRPKSTSGGPCSPNQAFLGKLSQTKVEEHPRYGGGGSGQIKSSTSPRGPVACPSARGSSAAMVIGPFKLKLGRCVTHMGTWPQRCFGLVGP